MAKRGKLRGIVPVDYACPWLDSVLKEVAENSVSLRKSIEPEIERVRTITAKLRDLYEDTLRDRADLEDQVSDLKNQIDELKQEIKALEKQL